MMPELSKVLDPVEFSRYFINGLLATALHYGVLTLNLQYLEMRSAGMANLLAAVFGITSSFVGNRYYVFCKHEGGLVSQARGFLLLYAAIACLHGLVLFGWTDIGGLDYRLGFFIAAFLQMILSYWGNKRLVFKK